MIAVARLLWIAAGNQGLMVGAFGLNVEAGRSCFCVVWLRVVFGFLLNGLRQRYFFSFAR